MTRTTTASTQAMLRLHPDDDVAVAVADLAPGAHVDPSGRPLTVPAAIPSGHKLALTDLPEGVPVRKYGQRIGVTTAPVKAGEHVHTHNLGFTPGELDHAFGVDARHPSPPAADPGQRTFDGYVRADGRVGTRNYLAVVTTVNCSATAARHIGDQAVRSGMLAGHPTVDGVVVLAHGTGCGMAADGEGLDLLRQTLTGYATHPNVAGVLVVGLGCEVNQIADLTDGWPELPDRPLRRMTIQDAGGTTATIRQGLATLRELLPVAAAVRRTPVPVSELVVGLECGGSDAYSGVTANPALGAASDLIVAHGGTTILGETPEVYGAEHLLTRRAASREVGERLLERIRWWEGYAAAGGGSLDNNPSPGNKAGGLTTILEKSLGAVAKAGTSPLVEVYRYAEPVQARGLVFMDTPGYDPVSVTGMVAGGATVVCFTTGRGSVFGCKPTPSIKLATNTPMYQRMREDMDLDCGVILGGDATVAEVGRRIFDLVLATASGRRTSSELLGFGDEEFAPWQLGAVM
jgi:altronate hydrolase